MRPALRSLLALCGVASLLAACESAPVTGRSQMMLVSESEERQMGLQAYQQVLSPTLLNEIRVGHTRRSVQRHPVTLPTSPGVDLGLPGIPSAASFPSTGLGLAQCNLRVAECGANPRTAPRPSPFFAGPSS